MLNILKKLWAKPTPKISEDAEDLLSYIEWVENLYPNIRFCLKDCIYAGYVVFVYGISLRDNGTSAKLSYSAAVESSNSSNSYAALSDQEKKSFDQFLGDLIMALIEIQHTEDEKATQWFLTKVRTPNARSN